MRLILTKRCGESAHVIPRADGATLEVCVLTDRIAPRLSDVGFVSSLVLERRQVQALILQLADAIGMACELREGTQPVGDVVAPIMERALRLSAIDGPLGGGE